MSLSRRNPRRDANEKDITDAAVSVGARFWTLSGKGRPDVLFLYRERFYVAEVKTTTGKLRETQRDVPWPVIRSVQDLFILLHVSTR